MTCVLRKKIQVENKFKDKVNEIIKNTESNPYMELPGKLKTRTRASGKALWITVVLQLGLKGQRRFRDHQSSRVERNGYFEQGK